MEPDNWRDLLPSQPLPPHLEERFERRARQILAMDDLAEEAKHLLIDLLREEHRQATATTPDQGELQTRADYERVTASIRPRGSSAWGSPSANTRGKTQP